MKWTWLIVVSTAPCSFANSCARKLLQDKFSQQLALNVM